MQDLQVPVKYPYPWANSAGSGFTRVVPFPSQLPSAPLSASFTDGWTPATFNLGGAPDGRDFNGLHNSMTSWLIWYQAQAPIFYDATFSAAQGGYPKGTLLDAVGFNAGYWYCLVDNNVTDPDTGGANWLFIQLGPNSPFLPTLPVTTFYVGGTGASDANDGQAVALGGGHGPWATLTHAASYISGYASLTAVIVNIAAGTYNGFNISASFIAGWSFIGAGVGSVFVNASTSSVNAGYAMNVNGGTVSVSDITLSAYYACVAASNPTDITVSNCNFVGIGSTSVAVQANSGGAFIFVQNTIVFSGTFLYVVQSQTNGYILFGYNGISVALTYSSVTATYVVIAQTGGHVSFIAAFVTQSGTPTAARFYVDTGAGISTGSGTSYINGSSAGTIVSATYGWYN